MKKPFPLLLGAAWLLFTGTAPATACAEPPSTDPTRPPSFAPVQATAAPTHARAAPVADVPSVPTRLQSVQVSTRGGSSALVDGRLVHVGERLGESTVVAIDAQGILLHGARSDQRLALLPGTGKIFSARAGPPLQPALAAKAAP